MLKEYKDKKTFKEIKYNYVNFEIQDYNSICNIDFKEKNIMTSDILDNVGQFVIKLRLPNSKEVPTEALFYMLYDTTSPIIEVYWYDYADYKFHLNFVFDISKEYKDISDIEKTLIYCSSEEMKQFTKYCLDLSLKSLYYIKEKLINRKVIYKEIKNNRTTANNNSIVKNKNTKKRIEVISEEKIVYFTIDNVTNSNLNSFKRSYNRRVELWYVLPHTRRYKSGKVIQVKGYYKGNKEGKKDNKTYVL